MKQRATACALIFALIHAWMSHARRQIEFMKHRVVPFAALATFSLVSLSALVPAAKAQEAPAEKLQKLSQVLALTPQQKSQLAPIVEAEAPKIQAIQKDPNLSGKEKMKQLKAIHTQSDPLVKSILSPTQYKQWEDIRKDEIEQMKAGGH
jgi:hypothetical protein